MKERKIIQQNNDSEINARLISDQPFYQSNVGIMSAPQSAMTSPFNPKYLSGIPIDSATPANNKQLPPIAQASDEKSTDAYN